MTIMVSGKNTSFPVTCLDLLCCAKPCRAFPKKKKAHLHPGSFILLSCLVCPEHAGAEAQRDRQMFQAACDDSSMGHHGKPGWMQALDVSL